MFDGKCYFTKVRNKFIKENLEIEDIRQIIKVRTLRWLRKGWTAGSREVD